LVHGCSEPSDYSAILEGIDQTDRNDDGESGEILQRGKSAHEGSNREWENHLGENQCELKDQSLLLMQ
jgi:hypothetical protein